jgi:hypothetical protein
MLHANGARMASLHVLRSGERPRTACGRIALDNDQGESMRMFQINGCGLHVSALVVAALLGGACATDPASEPATAASEAALSKCSGCSLPVGGLYATFRVTTETFKQHITSAAGISGALAAWRGTSRATIPVGTLSCQCTGWNCDWDFHMDPASITFTRAAIEVCDGIPSYVNSHCKDFGFGSYCPWLAQMIELRDCRIDPSCPVVPK